MHQALFALISCGPASLQPSQEHGIDIEQLFTIASLFLEIKDLFVSLIALVGSGSMGGSRSLVFAASGVRNWIDTELETCYGGPRSKCEVNRTHIEKCFSFTLRIAADYRPMLGKVMKGSAPNTFSTVSLSAAENEGQEESAAGHRMSGLLGIGGSGSMSVAGHRMSGLLGIGGSGSMSRSVQTTRRERIFLRSHAYKESISNFRNRWSVLIQTTGACLELKESNSCNFIHMLPIHEQLLMPMHLILSAEDCYTASLFPDLKVWRVQYAGTRCTKQSCCIFVRGCFGTRSTESAGRPQNWSNIQAALQVLCHARDEVHKRPAKHKRYEITPGEVSTIYQQSTHTG
ncbi:hypothetical protein KCU93_g354, partial [Aureobasidium melanogenum]